MALLANPSITARNSQFHLASGSSFKLDDHWVGKVNPCKLSLNPALRKNGRVSSSKRSLSVQAAYSGDSGRSSSAGIFVGGFILGGIVVGTLGCVYAPQISKALAGTDKKELMRKLPKFIYDEEKEMERTRKILADKIEQLNSAIDEVSSQLRGNDAPNGVASSSNEVEATA